MKDSSRLPVYLVLFGTGLNERSAKISKRLLDRELEVCWLLKKVKLLSSKSLGNEGPAFMESKGNWWGGEEADGCTERPGTSAWSRGVWAGHWAACCPGAGPGGGWASQVR